MKRNKNSNHLARNIILAALLAVLCIGGVELAACRHFAPETYDRIVAPARYAAGVVVDAGKAVLDAGKAALDAAWRFCRETGAQAVRFVGRTAQQAAAFWKELTAGPKEILLELDESPPPQPSGPEPTPRPFTEMLEVDGRQILTGGMVDVVYFCQADEEWADQPYGTDTIGPYGCGPTAMAIVVASMTDEEMDPAIMAAWAVEHGCWARRSGTYDAIVPNAAQAFGLEAESLKERTVDEMLRSLREGRLVVAHVGPGHFTGGGHFLVVRGVLPSGEVLVADPNSLERSLEVWDPQLIIDELSSARSSGAPLWAVYRSDT